jgi:Family of unknown function (DUF6912)
MRVYLPSTLPALAGLLRVSEIGSPPLCAFAVTPALREWYASGDMEELEYAALAAAARASLRLLSADPAAPPRRVVLAAEVPDTAVDCGTPAPGRRDRAAVLVMAAVPLAKVVSAHVDDPVAAADIRAAVAALSAADHGDDDAKFAVDGAEGHELLWYAASELPYLDA